MACQKCILGDAPAPEEFAQPEDLAAEWLSTTNNAPADADKKPGKLEKAREKANDDKTPPSGAAFVDTTQQEVGLRSARREAARPSEVTRMASARNPKPHGVSSFIRCGCSECSQYLGDCAAAICGFLGGYRHLQAFIAGFIGVYYGL